MPTGCDFKAVTFQASGGMGKDVQNILKQFPQQALPEHHETATYRSFYTVSIAVAIARGTAENLLGLARQIKKRGLEGALAQV